MVGTEPTAFDEAEAGPGAGEVLPGGFIAEVVRIGDTVRRTLPPNADFVAALLRHLAPTGLAPRHLGVDERGRQVLSHLGGRVPWRDREEPAYFSDPALTRLGGLIRTLHDACAGTGLAGDAETVCHRDLSPKNTVYRDSAAGPLPVAFLDWDLAGPGRRIEDVAFAGWHWGQLGGDADPVELGRRCRLLCDAYDAAAQGQGGAVATAEPPGLRSPDDADRASGCAPEPLPRDELVDVMLHQIEGTWRGIAAGADRGDPAMRRLHAAGAVDGVRRWHDWLLHHHPTVRHALHP